MMLLRIIAPHFAAGIVLGNDLSARPCAPIIKYMRGWSFAAIKIYCAKKRWTLEVVE